MAGFNEVYEGVKLAIEAGLTPMIWGPPAIGKTSMGKQLAIDLFGQPGETEKTVLSNHFKILTGNTTRIDHLTGIPHNVNNDMVWSKPGWIPKPDEASGGGIILLDEVTDAVVSIQKGFYTLALEHRIDEHEIPENWYVAMAGNRPEDKSGSKMLPSALITRCVHFGLYCDVPNFEPYLPESADIDIDQWLQWAVKNNIDPMIVAYLKTFKRPESIYRFQNTPRTLEMVSKLILASGHDYLSKTLHLAIIGTVGQVAGADLISFFRLASQIPDIDTILQDPDSAAIPTDYGILNALCACLIHVGNVTNADKILKYGRRLDLEPMVFLVELLRKKDLAIAGLPEFIIWRNQNSMYIG